MCTAAILRSVLLRFFRERPQTLRANVRTLAFHEQGGPLQIRPLFRPIGRVELTAELFPGPAHYK